MSGISVTYRAGEGREWIIAVADGRVLAVKVASAAERLDAMWTAVESRSPVAEILDRVIGGSLTGAPDFTLVGWDGDASGSMAVHVFSRGTLGATVTTASGTESIEADGVTTWAERRIDDVRQISIGNASDAGMPIAHGMVYADGCLISATPGAVAAPVARASVASSTMSEDKVSEDKVSEDTIASPVEDSRGVSAATPVAKKASAPTPPAVVAPEGESGAYDHLFGATVMRPIEDAAVRPPTEDDETAEHDAASAPESTEPDDLDEHTVMTDDISALRAKRRKDRGTPVATVEPAPLTYFLEASNGQREIIDGTLLLGRAPVVSRVPGGVVPRLVKVTTPNQELSRTHLEVKVEGGAVVATDLHSKNGTLVTAPGMSPQQLRAGEPTTVIPGSVIDLGDTAVYTVGEE